MNIDKFIELQNNVFDTFIEYHVKDSTYETLSKMQRAVIDSNEQLSLEQLLKERQELFEIMVNKHIKNVNLRNFYINSFNNKETPQWTI